MDGPVTAGASAVLDPAGIALGRCCGWGSLQSPASLYIVAPLAFLLAQRRRPVSRKA